MSETKIEIDLTKVLPAKITRTLQDNQVLCPACEGVGLIRGSDSRGEYIITCTKCHGNTYVKKCSYCGELEQGFYHHSCDGLRHERARETERKEQEKWEKAEKITYADARKRYEQVVIGWDTYLPVDEVLNNIADRWLVQGVGLRATRRGIAGAARSYRQDWGVAATARRHQVTRAAGRETTR